MADENSTPPERAAKAPSVQRSLTGSAAVDIALAATMSFSAGAGHAVGTKLVGKVLDRPPPSDPPQGVVLPPGVERE